MKREVYITEFILLLSFFILLSNSILADSLVSINDLTYHSKFEEQVFNEFEYDADVDYFALFLCADLSVNESVYKQYKAQFNENIDVYLHSPYVGMKDTKLVKKVYKNIHTSILAKYVMRAKFSDIFSIGEYQCVSGSMLYAMVFDELGIPYEIKETSNHVYLTAFPNSHSITVETTNPLKGVAMFDNQFKNNYVNYLKNNKLITKGEYDSTSVYDLFDSYYLSPETVDLNKLAGIQYYNNAISELEEQNYVNAFHTMEKAYFLHPNKRSSYFLLFTLASAIDHISVADDYYAEYAGKLCRFHGKTITTDQLVALFGLITEKQLSYEGNAALYDSSYHIIINEIKDTLLKNEISFIYNYERGRVLYNQSRYIESKPFLEKAYSLKQKNVDAENLFVASLVVGFDSRNTSGEQGEKTLNEFDSYAAKYPNLKNLVKFKNIRLGICLDLMDNYFYINKGGKAEYYRNRFEKNYKVVDKDYPFINNAIPRTYATGAAYYFRKGNNSQAKKLVLKGLEYFPDDYLLKSRLKALN